MLNQILDNPVVRKIQLRFLWGRSYILIQIVFWVSATVNLGLPGLYMDEAGGDWLAARFINPELENPRWIPPYTLVPILSSLYTTYFMTYLEYLPLKIFGITVETIRLSHLALLSISLIGIQKLVQKLFSKSRVTTPAICILASFTPFIYSFRSHFYGGAIGFPFLVFSMYYLVRSEKFSKRDYKISGILFGLTIFSYFNYLFVFPLILGIVILKSQKPLLPQLKNLAFGILFGLSGFLFGYIQLFMAQGGIQGGLSWISWAWENNSPLKDQNSLSQKVLAGIDISIESLLGTGNERLLLGKELNTTSSFVVPMLMILFIVFSTFLGVKAGEGILIKWIQIFPLIYVIVIGVIFGSRLGQGHYMVFLLLISISFVFAVVHLTQYFSKKIGAVKTNVIVIIMLCLMLLGNVYSNLSFSRELVRTGGYGLSTSAINEYSRDALVNVDRSVYFFPEWGFWMNFNTITQNKVPFYIDGVNWQIVSTSIKTGLDVNILSWLPENAEEYKSKALSISDQFLVKIQPRLRLDDSIAFYEVQIRSKN
jgi:hypothetical protein